MLLVSCRTACSLLMVPLGDGLLLLPAAACHGTAGGPRASLRVLFCLTCDVQLVSALTAVANIGLFYL